MRNIIHISGSPGSGKTTLGERLSAKNQLHYNVVETDMFIQPNNDNGKILMKMDFNDVKAYTKVWERILDKEIDKVVKENNKEVIVLVGILHNFGPKDGKIYTLKSYSGYNIYKFFIKIEPHILLKQYYMRIFKTCEKSTDEAVNKYWKDISENLIDDGIPSSTQVIHMHYEDIKWHVSNGYNIKTPFEIEREVRNKI